MELELKKRLSFSIFLVFLIHAVAVFLYHNVEGWGWIDSIYFTTATITTVGYGDVVPSTDTGKLITIALSWVGISVGFYMIYSVSRYREEVLDPALLRMLRRIGGKNSDKVLPKERNKYDLDKFAKEEYFRRRKRKP
jgi:hypothetical protein